MPTIYLDKGPAYGVGFIVPPNHPHLSGYLQPVTEDYALLTSALCGKHAKVAVLETVRIPDDRRRGQGFGRQILEEFKSRCRTENVSAILLVADTEEEQCPGFHLEAWYARHGFTAVLPTRHGPLYAYPESVAEDLLAATSLMT